MLSVSFDNVSFAYDTNHQLFKKLNLHLTKPDGKARGHVIAVMGPSGTGKTTLLRLICGVERPSSGDISISPKGATLSYLQQQPVLFDHLSLSSNARYFQQLHRTRLMFSEHTFDRLVQRLKLKTILGSKRGIHDLSGGERQRLSLLRALSIEPGILLLDEPCSGLDTDVKLEFLQILRSVVDELGLLALYVTHHADEAELIADELLYLEESRADSEAIVHILPIEKAFTSPPTLLAAQSLIGSASNKLACNVDRTGRLTTSRGELIGSITRGSFEVGQHTLVFPASSLKWNAYSGVPVAVVGQSGFHCFVAIPDGSTLIGAAIESPPGFCNIVGFAYLFLESCGVGIKVYISEAAPVDTGVDATKRGVTNN